MTDAVAAPAWRAAGARQVGTVLASQIVASGSNFAAAVLAARASRAAEFGPIAIAFAFYAVSAQLTRPFSGNVIQLTVLHPGVETGQARALGAAPVALLVGGLQVLIFVPAFALLVDAHEEPLVVLALALLPFLIVHDTLRLWAISIRRAGLALAMDLAWLLVLAVGLVVLEWQGEITGASTLAVWSAAGAGVAVGAWLAATVATRSPWDVKGAWNEARRIAPIYLTDAVLAAGTLTGFVILLPLVVGVAEVGRLGVVEMPFGVIATGSQGLGLYLLPMARRAAFAGRIERAWRLCYVSAAAIGIGTAVLGAIVLAVPPSTREGLLGPAYLPTFALIAAIMLKYASLGPLLVAATMTRALGARRETLRMSGLVTGAGVIAGLAAGLISLPASYVVLYGTLALGQLWIIRRVRNRPFDAATV